MEIKQIIWVTLFFSVALSSIAIPVVDGEIYAPSTRTFAIGGFHAADTDDLSTLFNNPAGFFKAAPQMSLSETTLKLSGPVFDIVGIIIKGMKGGTEDLLVSPDIQSLLQGLYAGLDVLGPIAFGYVGNGLGFGIFNNTNLKFTNSSPLTITSLISEEIILCGGYSFRIPFSKWDRSTLDFGVLMKTSLKGQLFIEKSFLEFPTLIAAIGTDGMGATMGEPFDFLGAIGLDGGLLYSFDDVFSVGLTARNIYTPVRISKFTSLTAFLDNTEVPEKSNVKLPVNLSAGVAFSPKLGPQERFLSDFTILLDYSDILDFWLYPEFATNPILHLGLGTEVTLLNIFSVEAGLNQGLFSAGLRLDVSFFTLSVAMFGSEISPDPGLNSVYNVMVGFEFRL